MNMWGLEVLPQTNNPPQTPTTQQRKTTTTQHTLRPLELKATKEEKKESEL